MGIQWKESRNLTDPAGEDGDVGATTPGFEGESESARARENRRKYATSAVGSSHRYLRLLSVLGQNTLEVHIFISHAVVFSLKQLRRLIKSVGKLVQDGLHDT